MTPLFAKIAIGSVALAALLYVAVCALMYFQQRKLMYFPQFTQVEAAHTNFSLQRDGLVLRGGEIVPVSQKRRPAVRRAVLGFFRE